jgi:hypothetical protein
MAALDFSQFHELAEQFKELAGTQSARIYYAVGRKPTATELQTHGD